MDSPQKTIKSGISRLQLASRLQLMLRAFQHRNYRLYFMGQGLSVTGTWMQTTAMSWLVYRITGDPFMLGLVPFVSLLPATFIAPFAGVIADRHNRRQILMVTQFVAMLQAGALAVLTLTGLVQVWHIMALGMCLGIVNAFDIPTRQSFIINMVERKSDLGNAIALNSIMFNIARFIGPGVAGYVIATTKNEGWCFLLNSISFMAVLTALLRMDIVQQARSGAQKHILVELREGAKYVKNHPVIRAVLVQALVMSLLGMSYASLMPIFAKDILHGDARTQGLLISCSGAGALMGAAFLASRRNARGLESLIPLAGAVFGVGVIIFSQSKLLGLSMGLMVMNGMCATSQMAACNTLVQTVVDDDKRGRVMSFYTMSFMHMVPVGALIAGFIAKHQGAPTAATIGGICCVVGSIYFATKLPRLRAIVRERVREHQAQQPATAPEVNAGGGN
jgi:MFS family permease